MSKSKTSIKRRKTSKQKTFQFIRNGERFKIKGLTAQSALSKLLRNRVTIHETKITIFDKGVSKLQNSYSNVVSSFDLYLRNMSKLRILLNILMRIFGFKPSLDIQKKELSEQNEYMTKAQIKRDNFELSRPYLSEFKIVF